MRSRLASAWEVLRPYLLLMPIDAKHEDLQSLHIDRALRGNGEGEPSAWARRYIIAGIVIVVLLGLSALAYRRSRRASRKWK